MIIQQKCHGSTSLQLAVKNFAHNIVPFSYSYTHKFLCNGDILAESKTDHHLLRQKVRQRISVMKEKKNTMFPENWHYNSRFVLKTTKTPVSV